MSDRSQIEWCDATWNPLRGCTEVSRGCAHCYAAAVAARFSGPGQPYEGLAYFDANGHAHWTGRLREVPEKLADPLKWRKPRRVFVNSMSDLFHEDVSDDFIAACFGAMAIAWRHTYQVLTKRADRMAEVVPRLTFHRCISAFADRAMFGATITGPVPEWPLPNVWLGVSCEDQATADARIPHLLRADAAVRFLSCEPLLGPIDLTRIVAAIHPEDPVPNAFFVGSALAPAPPHHFGFRRAIDWVIVGGESGPGARRCDVAWIRDVVRQCREAAVACFVKQVGRRPYDSDAVARVPDSDRELSYEEAMSPEGLAKLAECLDAGSVRLRDRKGGDMDEWPEDVRVREFPADPTPSAEAR